MSNRRNQAQFRQHLAELRRAAGGLGHDFSSELSNLDQSIERFGRSSAKDAKYLARQIEDNFSALGHALDEEARRLPGRIAGGAVRAGGATRDAFVAVGRKTRQGTRNALASAAGVNRKPMRTWSPPDANAPASDE
jgi:predicted phage gp36 major capsid-like protein